MENKVSSYSDDDDGHAFKLLLSCPSGLSPSQVSVIFDQQYDRIPHPDLDLEKSISEIWDQRVQHNSSFYNGLKFRYGGCNFSVGNDPKQEPHASLHLGLTDYRTFVGTNLSPMWERFLVPSEDDGEKCQHTSSPLGNGAVVETSDKRILVLQRSSNVGEFPGYFVFPGGHPEPQEVGIVCHESRQDLNQCQINRKLSAEMFDSIVREVVEEIGVPASTLDGFESTQLYAVSMGELENMASKMPGCHRGGFVLYKLMVQDRSS